MDVKELKECMDKFPDDTVVICESCGEYYEVDDPFMTEEDTRALKIKGNPLVWPRDYQTISGKFLLIN